MKRPRILLTIPNFLTAGSQQVVLSLFEKFDKEKFDVHICVEKNPESIPSWVPFDKRLEFRFSGNLIADVFRYRRFLKENQIDLVHSWDYKSNFQEALSTRLSGRKYLYTKKNNSWNKKWRLKSYLSSHIAYDNPEMKERFFSSALFKNKISFIPHGVDTGRFSVKEKIAGETFNLVCVGNINANKNQLMLLHVLKELPEEFVLHLYGNEERNYREELDLFIDQHGLKHRVVFHGLIENSNLPEVFRKMNLFISTSKNEGLPVSILEAMACGLLVLSSDSGGGSKYLLPKEMIFDSTEELIDKILWLKSMNEDEHQKWINRNTKRVKKGFTLEKEVMAYEELYKLLLKKTI